MLHNYTNNGKDICGGRDDDDMPSGAIPAAGKARARWKQDPAPESEYNVSFDDIYGYDNVKTALYKIIDMAGNAGKYTKLGVRMPRGIILYGEPGVGKTMMAQAVMHEMHRPAYILRKVQSDNVFLHLISDTFSSAKETAPSVILLDDLDKFSNARDVTDEYAAVQAGIDSVKDSDVFVIATVNDIDRLPKALYRQGRFDRKIAVPLPSTEDAALIIGKCLAGKKISKDMNMKTVAKLLNGHTSAALDSVINEAGLYAGFAGKDEIGIDDIVQAILSEVYDIDIISEIPLEQKIEIAYHEAGHAAADMLFNPGSVAIVSVCSNEDMDLGGFITKLRRHQDTYASRCQDIVSGLAGRAAVEIKFAHTDMGATSDICRAAKICDMLIQSICAKGFAFSFEGTYEESDSTRNAANIQHSRMMEDSYQEAKTLLHDNWALVEAIAQALIRKDTLICDELDAIYADYISGSARCAA